MYFRVEAGRQMILNIALLDVAHFELQSFGCVVAKCSSGAKPGMLEARKGQRNVLSAYAEWCWHAGNRDDLLPLGSSRRPRYGYNGVLSSGGYGRPGTRSGNERRVGSMTETARTILLPTKKSANWRCSDCAWSQPFVQGLEVMPSVPSKAIEDAFIRHKCTEHRHPKWPR